MSAAPTVVDSVAVASQKATDMEGATGETHSNNMAEAWRYEPLPADKQWVDHLDKGFPGDFIRVLSITKAIRDEGNRQIQDGKVR